MDKRVSFGVLGSEQTRLRGFGGTAGAVGLGLLSGDAVAVNGRFGEKVKCLGRETEFVLRDWLAAAVAFHGGCWCQAALASAGK